jgi:hypothetical protein
MNGGQAVMPIHNGAIRGVIHGKTIQLDRETCLPDGQEVIVNVQPIADERERLPPGEGIRRSAGAWADAGPELDEFLEWNRQQRKIGRPAI